jgi:hypothetical protein
MLSYLSDELEASDSKWNLRLQIGAAEKRLTFNRNVQL